MALVVVVVHWAMRDPSDDRPKYAVMGLVRALLRGVVRGLEDRSLRRPERELARPCALPFPAVVRSTTGFCLVKAQHRALQAFLTKCREHASMLASGVRPLTGPPNINNALPASYHSPQQEYALESSLD